MTRPRTTADTDEGAARLSPRQLEAAKLVHLGLSNKAMAAVMGIGVKTVKLHIHLAGTKVPGGGKARVKLTRWCERHYGEAA